MAKKPEQKNETELRRWCVESAIRWPIEGSYAAVYSQGGGTRSEADVIGRAKKIYEWVTGR